VRPFDRLAMRQPKLREIEQIAFSLEREARGRSPVCRAWLYEGIHTELVRLLAHDPQGLAVAENWLWDILPECRGCGCAHQSLA
jgi:hypothetical protein